MTVPWCGGTVGSAGFRPDTGFCPVSGLAHYTDMEMTSEGRRCVQMPEGPVQRTELGLGRNQDSPRAIPCWSLMAHSCL